MTRGGACATPLLFLREMKPHEYYYLAKKNILPDADQRTRIRGDIKKGSKVHVSAVCGKAMASIACMLKDLGYAVTGSDAQYSMPMSGVLNAHGIASLEPSLENLANIDVLVVGNTLKPSAPEVVGAREKNIPMISGAEAVKQLFADKRSLVVAGTHGKTTTSALLTHVFIEAGKNPAYMIGGVFQNSDDSYSIGGNDAKMVIYEGDEYNSAFFDRAPKFLHYNPSSAILTSIEHDHVDLYPTFEDYKQAFQFLVDELPQGGFLVIHESALPYVDISKCLAQVYVYGSSSSANIQYKIQKIDEKGTTFSLHSDKIGNIDELFIPMFGEYNIANATSVSTLATLEGLSRENIATGLKTYSGTKERQELIGTRGGNIAVIRDYAHHPTAVSFTLDGLRLRYPGKRLLAIFEPRSSSSIRKVFEERYIEALEKADVSIIISPVFKETDDRKNCVDVVHIAENLKSKGHISYGTTSFEETLDTLSKIVSANDVVVFMSSGDMDGIPQKFLTNS